VLNGLYGIAPNGLFEKIDESRRAVPAKALDIGVLLFGHCDQPPMNRWLKYPEREPVRPHRTFDSRPFLGKQEICVGQKRVRYRAVIAELQDFGNGLDKMPDQTRVDARHSLNVQRKLFNASPRCIELRKPVQRGLHFRFITRTEIADVKID